MKWLSIVFLQVFRSHGCTLPVSPSSTKALRNLRSDFRKHVSLPEGCFCLLLGPDSLCTCFICGRGALCGCLVPLVNPAKSQAPHRRRRFTFPAESMVLNAARLGALLALLAVTPVISQERGAVRMLGDPQNSCHGRVQLFDGAEWGSIPVGAHPAKGVPVKW